MGCASDSMIPKFLRATLETSWRARIDLCMHNLVQPQTHLPICRSVFVYTPSWLVCEALDRRCDGHCGLPHAVLNSGKAVRESLGENCGQIPNPSVPERYVND